MSNEPTTSGLLPTRKQVEAIAKALRRDYTRFDIIREPDSELIQPVENPFESVETAADRLSQLESRLRERDDRRAVFLSIYVQMTKEVQEAITTDEFADSEWMRNYLVTFANYYRRAFLHFEQGDIGRIPVPWKIAFATSVRGNTLIAQDAFLGVNAHINYDLALTLRDVGIDPNRAQKYADHRAVNDVLARLVDVQQELLAERYAPGLDQVDTSLGSLDEVITLFSLTEGREQAWRIASVLVDTRLSVVRSYARWLLRTTATGGALFILTPNLDPTVLWTLRQIEADDLTVNDVIDQFQARV